MNRNTHGKTLSYNTGIIAYHGILIAMPIILNASPPLNSKKKTFNLLLICANRAKSHKTHIIASNE